MFEGEGKLAPPGEKLNAERRRQNSFGDRGNDNKDTEPNHQLCVCFAKKYNLTSNSYANVGLRRKKKRLTSNSYANVGLRRKKKRLAVMQICLYPADESQTVGYAVRAMQVLRGTHSVPYGCHTFMATQPQLHNRANFV